MAMKAPKEAVCGLTSCSNNINGVVVAVCSGCGRCASCKLRHGCDTSTSGMVNALVAICGHSGCVNNTNRRRVMVCGACGRCAACVLRHRH
jgi:hypothetical protein